MYTAESLQQFELLKNWSAEHRQEISVFPRLTSGNQFGMDQKTIEELIENRQNYPFLKIRGIHYFFRYTETFCRKDPEGTGETRCFSY